MKKAYVGFVGVGKWARLLVDAFNIEGESRVIRYVRKNAEHANSLVFGERCETVAEMIDEGCNLIVAAADPITTAETVRYCVENCIPVVATKPLRWHPKILGAPLWVDFWRLCALPYLEFKENVQNADLVEIDFHGAGPWRETMDGLDDYGPHVFAFLSDLEFSYERSYGLSYDHSHELQIVRVERNKANCKHDSNGTLISEGHLWTIRGGIGKTEFRIVIGNGSYKSLRRVRVHKGGVVHDLEEIDETLFYRFGGEHISATKEACRKRFAERVLFEWRMQRPHHWFGTHGWFGLSESEFATDTIERIRAIAG